MGAQQSHPQKPPSESEIFVLAKKKSPTNNTHHRNHGNHGSHSNNPKQPKQQRRPIQLYSSVQEASYRLVKRHLSEKNVSELLPTSTCPTSEQLLGLSTVDKRASCYSTATVSSSGSIATALFTIASTSSSQITPLSSISSCHAKHRVSSGHEDEQQQQYKNRSSSSSNDLQHAATNVSQDSDVLRYTTASSSICSSITTAADNITENEIYSSLVNNAAYSKMARVWVAQCKVHGFFNRQPDVQQGYYELSKLAKDGVAEAYAPLAVCFDYGLTPNRQSDPQRAYKWYKKAAGTDTRMIAFAYYRLGVLSNTKPAEALKYFHLSATNGSANGQYMLGLYYQHGIAVKANAALAQKWYTSAAEQGDADAQAALGLLLLDHGDETHKGVGWLELSAEQNNARALLRLGSFYEEAHDHKRAMTYYQRAAATATTDRDLALAHYLVGINYRMGDLGLATDAQRAVQHLTVSANAGYAPAQRALGLMHAQGIGTPKDEVKAHKLYSKAALQGDIRAIGLLAEQNEHGRGCIMDIKNALQLYEKAANAGSVAAQLSLAELLQRIGRRAQAFPWFEKVAAASEDLNVELIHQRNTARLMVARYRLQGWGGVERKPAWAFNELITLADCDRFVDAYYWVAACYEEGVFVQRNILKAFEYYEKAATNGDTDGQFQVALMLANGVSEPPVVLIKRDQARAFEWYVKAADAGHKTAQYSLGLYYAKAISPITEIDNDKAAQLFERAASQGLVVAMVQLGKLMLATAGQEQEALYWLRRAASQGDAAGMRELAAAYESGAASAFLKDGGDIANARAIALQLLKKAAEEKNDALSWCAMARYHEQGWSVPIDIQEAVRCYNQAESLDYPKAGLALADMYERHAMWQEALDKYDQMASKNKLLSSVGWKSRLAKGRLVVFHRKGTAEDESTVLAWLHDMVEQDTGAVEPFEMLGACCEYGRGTAQDISSAITWYEAAVAQSKQGKATQDIDWVQQRARFRLGVLCFQRKQHAAALNQFQAMEPLLEKMNHHSAETRQHARLVRYYLGYLLLRGDNIEHQIEKAKKWLSEAADEGEGAAAYELGMWALENDDDDQVAKRRFDQGVSARHAGCMRQFALLLEREQRDDPKWDGRDTLEWLEDAARLGDVEALVHLGTAYERGLGTGIAHGQIEKALPLYVAAAQQDNIRAMIKAGETFSKMGRHCEAVSWFKKAESYSLTARTTIALYRLHGRGGLQQEGGFASLQNIVKETVANDDDKRSMSLAMFLLGQCFELGRETPRNLEEALAWYHRAVDMFENTDAMYHIGALKSIEGNEVVALEWFRRAAEKDRHCESLYQLGLFHKLGRGGLEANLTVARNYFTRASDQGHPRAKFELAHILWRKQEYQDAFHLYDVAAKLMVPEALRELGNLHHQGFPPILPRDYGRAFRCFCEAAQLLDATAALMVGTYFEEGYLEQQPGAPSIGMDRDQALQWYETAYRLGCGSLAELAIGNLKHKMADELGPEAWEEAEDLREEAFVWFSEVAKEFKEETQHANIMVALYHIHGWGRTPIDPEQGFEQLREIAEIGGTQAYAEVARCYDEGIGVERDISRALTYWELAAEVQQDIAAMMRAGEIYEQGLAGHTNPSKASQYFVRAKASASSQRSPSEVTSSSSSSSSYALSARSSMASLRNRSF